MESAGGQIGTVPPTPAAPANPNMEIVDLLDAFVAVFGGAPAPSGGNISSPEKTTLQPALLQSP